MIDITIDNITYKAGATITGFDMHRNVKGKEQIKLVVRHVLLNAQYRQ